MRVTVFSVHTQTHTHTHATVSQLVSLSTVKLFPVIEFLQLCAPVVDSMSYPPEQGRVSLLTVTTSQPELPAIQTQGPRAEIAYGLGGTNLTSEGLGLHPG